MVVLSLVERANRETVAALESLLEAARAGELSGLAACFKLFDCGERAVFVGAYKARPNEAIGAAMRLTWRLTRAQDADP